MDSKLGQNFAIQLDAFLVELADEDRVLASGHAHGGVQANDPERTEVALVLLAIHVRVLTSFHNCFLCLCIGRTASGLVAFGKLANLLVSAVPNNTSLNAHGSGELDIRNESFNRRDVCRIKHNRAVHALLALALLLEQVVTAVAFHSQLAASGLANSLLCAAV